FHATMDEYFIAKAALFTPERVSIAVVNHDDEYGRELGVRCALNDLPLITFGIDARKVDVVATDLEPTERGTRFRLDDRRTGDSAEIAFPHAGRFNASNALAAGAASLGAGSTFDAVAAGLQEPVVVPGRLERIDVGQPFTVLVDYAHTPAALESVLGAA